MKWEIMRRFSPSRGQAW